MLVLEGKTRVIDDFLQARGNINACVQGSTLHHNMLLDSRYKLLNPFLVKIAQGLGAVVFNDYFNDVIGQAN